MPQLPRPFVVLRLKLHDTDGRFEILRMPRDSILALIQSVDDYANEQDEGAHIHHFLTWCGIAWTCSQGSLEHDYDNEMRFASVYTFTTVCAQNSEVFPLLYLGNSGGELWTTYFSRKGLSWPQVDVKDILERAMLELASPLEWSSLLRKPLREGLHRRDNSSCGFTSCRESFIYHNLTHRLGDAFIVAKALQAHAMAVASGGRWQGPDPLQWSIDDPPNAFVTLAMFSACRDRDPQWGIFPSPTHFFSRECIAFKRYGFATEHWPPHSNDLRYTLHEFSDGAGTLSMTFVDAPDTPLYVETGVDYVLRENVEDTGDPDLQYPPAWIVEVGYVARLFCSFMGDDLARLVQEMQSAWDEESNKAERDEDLREELDNLDVVFMLMPRPNLPLGFDWQDRSGFDFNPSDTNARSLDDDM